MGSEKDYDGAPSGKSDRFNFLRSTVSGIMETQGRHSGSSTALLSERSLRKLEDPCLAVSNIVGLTACGLYGIADGFSFVSPSGHTLQLSPKAFAKSWSLAKPQRFDEPFWRKLLNILDAARLTAPLQLCILSWILPHDKALVVQEHCLNHLAALLAWNGIILPAEDAAVDPVRDASVALKVKKWLESCYQVLAEVVKELDKDFIEVDSSVYLQKWSSFRPVTGTSWGSYCVAERRLAAEVEYVRLDSGEGWKIRRDHLVAALRQFSFFSDTANQSQWLPKLNLANSLPAFDKVLEDLVSLYSPLTLDQLLGSVGEEVQFKVVKGVNAAKTATSPSAESITPTGGKSAPRGVCRLFASTGHCSYGDLCKYRHVKESFVAPKQGDKSSSKTVSAGPTPSVSRSSPTPVTTPPPPRRSARLQQNKGKSSAKTDKSVATASIIEEDLSPANTPAVANATVDTGNGRPNDISNLVCEGVKTVKGFVRTTPYSESITARCCCDSGSQINLVTHDFVVQHDLVTECIKPIEYVGVGGERHKFSSVINVGVSLGWGFSAVRCGIVPVLPAGSALLLNNATSEKLLASLDAVNDPIEAATLHDAIESSLPSSWTSLRSANGFVMRCRRLEEGETRDCPNQRYCLEVALDSMDDSNDPLSVSSRRSLTYDFGNDIYQKLNEYQQRSYDEAVQTFCDNGHWEPISSERVERERDVPVIVCFPAVSRATDVDNGDFTKTTSFRVRPVLHAGQLNSDLASSGRYASYGGLSTHEILSALRLNFAGDPKGVDDGFGVANRALVTMDISRAFYRFRMASRGSQRGLEYVFVLCNHQFFICHRIPFGVVHGPSVLETGVQWILRTLYVLEPSFKNLVPLYFFYDDLQAVVDIHLARKLIGYLSVIGECLGLPFPSDKTSILCDVAPSVASIPTSAAWSTKLGVLLRVHCGELQTRCASRRLSYVEGFNCEDPIPTRSQFFAFTGVLHAYNVLGCHPEIGYLAALLSRYAGRAKPKGSWSKKLQLSDTEHLLIKRLVELLQQQVHEAHDCVHQSVPLKCDTLCLTSDASMSAYAYVICAGSPIGELLRAKAVPWNDKIHGTSWHINRRELYSFLMGLMAVDSLLEQDHWYRRISYLQCFMDSLSVTHWLHQNCPNTKGIERTAVRRLVSAANELLYKFKEVWHIHVDVVHNAGDSSTMMPVDNLSRLSSTFGIDDLIEKVEKDVDVPLTIVATSSTSTSRNEIPRGAGDEEVEAIGQLAGNLGHDFMALLSAQSLAAVLYDDTKWSGIRVMDMLDGGVPPTLNHRFRVVRQGQLVCIMVSFKTGDRFYIPLDKGEYELRSRLLAFAHDSTAHYSATQMRIRLMRFCYWNGLPSDCERVVRNCVGCAKERVRHDRGAGYRETVVSRRFTTVFLDFCGPNTNWYYYDPATKSTINNCSILVMVDACSGWTELAACASQDTETVVAILFDKWIARFGVPVALRSDLGSSFCGRVMRRLYERLEIEFQGSRGHSPETQGQVEVVVRSIKRALQRLTTNDLCVLPFVQRTLNSIARVPNIGRESIITPEILTYGEPTRGSLETFLGLAGGLAGLSEDDPSLLASDVKEAVRSFSQSWSLEVAQIRAKAIDDLNYRAGSSAITAEHPQLRPGDLVFRVTRNGLGRTLSSGPFIVTSSDDRYVYVEGYPDGFPLHQVRMCTANPSYAPDDMSLSPPDPHHLLPVSRDQLQIGTTILFVVVEWYDDEEVWAYDVGIIKENIRPTMKVNRLLVDAKGRWACYGDEYDVVIHYCQVVATVQLTARGCLSKKTKGKLAKAGLPISL